MIDSDNFNSSWNHTNCNDGTWIIKEDDEWIQIKKSAQEMSELIDELQQSACEDMENIIRMMPVRGLADVRKPARLMESLTNAWLADCAESEQLRLKLKRATHNSRSTAGENCELEQSLSKMREQLGIAIDNSVLQLEELTICNNSLSDQIQELEERILRAEAVCKQHGQDYLDSLREILLLSKGESANIVDIQERLCQEVDKIDRMIVGGNSFGESSKDRSNNLIVKSSRMVDTILKGLVETLKKELEDFKNVVNTQRNQIKNFEKEKEEFLQLAGKSDDVRKATEMIDLCRESLLQSARDNAFDVTSDSQKTFALQSNLKFAKQLSVSLEVSLDFLYKRSVNKDSRLYDMRDNISDLNSQILESLDKIHCLDSENLKSRKEIELLEKQLLVTNDELNTAHARLEALELAYETVLQENHGLKGGKENFQGFCSSLSGENESLSDKLRVALKERDDIYKVLKEETTRMQHLSKENSSLQNKRDVLEVVLAKLRCEYQEQARELASISREKESLKVSIQDCEHDKSKLKQVLKSVEGANKDLEDQIFQLASENQKLRNEIAKITSNRQDLDAEVAELNRMFEQLKDDKVKLDNQLIHYQIAQAASREEIRSLKTEVQKNSESKDRCFLLPQGYKNMVTKLLHQHDELLRLCKLDQREDLPDTRLQSCLMQAFECKDAEELDATLTKYNIELERTFQSVSFFLNEILSERQVIVGFFDEISGYLDTRLRDRRESCCSTEGPDVGCEVAARLDASSEKRGKTSSLPSIIARIRLEVEAGIGCKLKLRDTAKKLLNANRKQKLLRKRLIEYKRIKAVSTRQARRMHCMRRSKRRADHVCTDAETEAEATLPDLDVTVAVLNRARDQLVAVKKCLQPRDDGDTQQFDLSTSDCTGVAPNELERVNNHLSTVIETLSSHVKQGTFRRVHFRKEAVNVDKLVNEFENLSLQRAIMLQHMNLTNERLEILLNCMKGYEEGFDTSAEAVDEASKARSLSHTDKLQLLMRKNLKSDETVMKRAVNILELTKAISIADLTDENASKSTNDDEKEILSTIECMNSRVESILREARSSFSGRMLSYCDRSTGITPVDNSTASASTVAQVSEMEERLKTASRKVEDLSSFLEQRESELKNRDEKIACLQAEYDELKALSEHDAKSEAAYERLIKECKSAKDRLENENAFLQMVVKELRQELLQAHKACRAEEETKRHLEEFVKELEICKFSLEESLDKMAFELNMLKCDRENLVSTLHSLSATRCSWTPSFERAIPLTFSGCAMYGAPNPITHHPWVYPDCQLCACSALSESSALPVSEEECDCDGSFVSYARDADSIASDDDKDENDVLSSSESQTTTSRIARITSTEEATLAIRSQSRSPRYRKKETRTRTHLIPAGRIAGTSKHAPKCDSREAPPDAQDSNVQAEEAASSSSETPSERVRGRRELRHLSALPCPPASGFPGGSLSENRTHSAGDVPMRYLGHNCKKRKKRPFLSFGRK